MKKIPTLMDRELKKITRTINEIIVNTLASAAMLFFTVDISYETFIEGVKESQYYINLLSIVVSISMLIFLIIRVRKSYIFIKLLYKSILIDVNTVINVLHKCDPKSAAELTGITIIKRPNQTIH